MANRLARLLIWAPLIGGAFAAPARAYIAEDRWTSTATNGFVGSVNAVGVPVTLTWSFAPNGTQIPGNTEGTTTPSNLLTFLDTTFGVGPGGTDLTQRPWFPYFQQSFDRLGALSGVTYVYESHDSTTAFSEFDATGSIGVRGDVRLGGKSYGVGSNILASNFFPNYGEMMINTDQGTLLGNSNSNYLRLRNTVMHEAMHGLGISHVDSTSAFLIEPVSTLAFDGPQLDDILAIQRRYGDAWEKNGGNDTYLGATQLGTLTATQSLIKGTFGNATAVAATATDFLSIDDNSDTDYFKFTLNESLDVSIVLTPKGTTYSVGPVGGTQTAYNSLAASNLSLALFDVNGTTQLGATANANGAGAEESLYRHLGPGQYYARVKGAQNDIQLYQIAIISGLIGAPPLKWVGGGSNAWDFVTPNFFNGTASDVFHDQIDVTFDDTAIAKTVQIPANVSPGDVVVSTASSYEFTGPGGIVSGSLTVDGSGTVELANAGNAYSGATTVAAGTLKITGNANAMVSPITIANGATLVLDATDASTMTSLITVQVGGELRIGTLASNANVLADSPAGIVNDGVMRVFDDEQISQVSGVGAIVVENETSQLASNASFHGMVTVKSGAVAELLNSNSLGDAAGATIVESGGSVLASTSATIAENFTLAGDGLGAGALHATGDHAILFQGAISGSGANVMLGVDGGAFAIFFGSVDVSPGTPLTLRAEEDSQMTFAGSTSFGGGLTKTGDGLVQLAGEVAFGGPTVIANGTLRLAGSGPLTGLFEVAQGALLDVGGAHTFSQTAQLTGSGEVSGNFVMSGTISPGEGTGVLTLLNDLELSPASLTEIELGGPTLGVEFDQLAVGGVAGLDGDLRVTLINGFAPAAHDSFAILTASQIAGTFDEIMLPALDSGLFWDVSYMADQVLLSVSAAAMYDPTDFNEDGSVDGDDFAAWQTGFGASTGAMHADGDANGDFAVDGLDFLAWQRGFADVPGAVSALSSVPEPCSAEAILVGLLCLIRASRRRASLCQA